MLELTDKQQEIKDNALQKNNAINYIKGYAGTGKTITSAAIVKEIMSSTSSSIMVVAPTSTALDNIRQKIDSEIGHSRRIYFKTLASLIKRVEKYIQSPKGIKFPLNSKGISQLNQFLKGLNIDSSSLIKEVDTNGEIDYLVNADLLNDLLKAKINTNFNFELTTDFVIISEDEIIDKLKFVDYVLIDEASMVNDIEMKALNDAILKFNKEQNNLFGEFANDNKKIIWVGDNKQLPPVDGKVAKEFVNNKENVLTEVLRSNDKVIDYATLVRNKSINSLLNKTEIANDLTDYLYNNIDELLKYDVVLTFTNRNVNLINSILRSNFTESDTLTVGEPIVIDRNARNNTGRTIAYNSQRVRISNIKSQDETVQYITNILVTEGIDAKSEDERYLYVKPFVNQNKLRLIEIEDEVNKNRKWVLANVNINNNRVNSYESQIIELITKACQNQKDELVYIYWKSAYAMTVHKSQGSEWPRVVYIYQLNRRPFAQNKNLDYTAITRAKSDIKIIAYTN